MDKKSLSHTAWKDARKGLSMYEPSNELISDKEFIQKFRDMMIDVKNLSQKTPNKIYNGGEYRHCHKTKNERNKKNCKFCVINSILE